MSWAQTHFISTRPAQCWHQIHCCCLIRGSTLETAWSLSEAGLGEGAISISMNKGREEKKKKREKQNAFACRHSQAIILMLVQGSFPGTGSPTQKPAGPELKAKRLAPS